MGINPGIFTIECDRCGKEDEVEPTEYAGDPATWGVDMDDAEGWAELDGDIVCPDCKKDS